MIGGGLGLPLLMIFGFYGFQKPLLRIVCLIGIVGWMSVFLVKAIVDAEWNLLIFPAIIGFGWLALHGILKDR